MGCLKPTNMEVMGIFDGICCGRVFGLERKSGKHPNGKTMIFGSGLG